MKTIHDIEVLEGVKVIVRVDYNVPIQNGVVVDDFRIRSSLETVNFLLKGGAKVILIAHLEGTDGSNPTLLPVSESLKKLGVKNTFIANIKNAFPIINNELGNGECVLLENLRFSEGEKKNDAKFAKELASLADIYVNEAFSVCHREHASIVGLPAIMPGYAGVQLNKEVANLSRAFSPLHPFAFIIGGAKFETKMPLIQRFSKIADSMFVGGALANDILQARNFPVGMSRVSGDVPDIEEMAMNKKIIAPIDVVVQDHVEKKAYDVLPKDVILDAGKETIGALTEVLEKSKFVLWNGPLGQYENGYQGATLDLAKVIAGCKETNGSDFVSIVGGGDTVAAIASLGLQDKFTFISTGGGAMLDFLAKGTLPGIEALKG